MEKDSRRTKDGRFIVELSDRAMNIILLIYVKIEHKISAFDIRGSSGRREDFFVFLLWSGG